jgi:hypothetical protein
MQRLITSVPGHASQHASSWWGRRGSHGRKRRTSVGSRRG